MYTLEGVSDVTNFITAYENSIKPRLPFTICNVFLISKGKLLDFNFNFTALQLVIVSYDGRRSTPRTSL